jgi:replicative superfamily II helicase
MSALKERAKQLIDQLPDEVVSQLLEDLEDALDLEEAIATSDPSQAVELHEFLRRLRAEGHPAVK